MAHLSTDALRRGYAEAIHSAATGLPAHLAYFARYIPDALQPSAGRLQQRSTLKAAGSDVKARVLWAEADAAGCAVRLLCAAAPTAAVSCLFVFG